MVTEEGQRRRKTQVHVAGGQRRANHNLVKKKLKKEGILGEVNYSIGFCRSIENSTLIKSVVFNKAFLYCLMKK